MLFSLKSKKNFFESMDNDVENKGKRNVEKIKSPYNLQSIDKYLRQADDLSQGAQLPQRYCFAKGKLDIRPTSRERRRAGN